MNTIVRLKPDIEKQNTNYRKSISLEEQLVHRYNFGKNNFREDQNVTLPSRASVWYDDAPSQPLYGCLFYTFYILMIVLL